MRKMKKTSCVLAALLLTLAGCNGPGPRGVAPRDAREAVERINANLEKIDGALYCPATTSFRFRDDHGHDRRFIGHRATVIFEEPRDLYFDVKHALGGSVARIASNDERYWFWIDTPDTRRLWHGSWARLEGAARMAVPPRNLLDALMLRPLPAELDGALRPLLRIDGDDQHLLYVGLDRGGWPYVKREMRLDPKPPYMPLEIIDRSRTGEELMRAHLSKYRPVKGVGSAGPYTPRKYVVYWRGGETEMRLDLSDASYRTNDLPFCEFPDQWDGEVEDLDAAPVEESSVTE